MYLSIEVKSKLPKECLLNFGPIYMVYTVRPLDARFLGNEKTSAAQKRVT